MPSNKDMDLLLKSPKDSMTYKFASDNNIPKQDSFPSYSAQTSYGYSLRAAKDVPKGTVVEKFIGPDVAYSDCSNYDKCYVLVYFNKKLNEWRYLLPLTRARYLNHSCDPNCIITDTYEVITTKDIKQDEELTFLYNNGQDTDWWDDIWSFKCECGKENCQGMIDRYRPVESKK